MLKVKDYLKKQGYTQQEVAERLGVSTMAVNQLLNGKNKFGAKTATAWANEFGFNPLYLMTGEGEMLATEQPADVVPVYGVEFSAGFVERFPDNEQPIGYLNLPDYRKATAVVSVTGDSMAPLISSGDRVILQELPVEQASIIYGGIYALVTANDLRTIKRVRRSSKEGYIDLEPVNKDVADTTPIPFTSVTHLWRVLGSLKSFL